MIAALLPRLVLWLWFFAALLGGPLLLLRLPAAGIPVLVAMVTIAGLRLSDRTTLHESLERLTLRQLVLLHAVRIAGLGLLFLHLRGHLDGDFALPVGLGELAVGVMALPVALAPLAPAQRRRATLIWNIAGLTELLLAIGLATRLAVAEPGFHRALCLPPFVVIPLFVVPVLAASHILLLARTRPTEAPTSNASASDSARE